MGNETLPVVDFEVKIRMALSKRNIIVNKYTANLQDANQKCFDLAQSRYGNL